MRFKTSFHEESPLKPVQTATPEKGEAGRKLRQKHKLSNRQTMTSPTVKKEWSPPGKTDILNYRYYEASQGKGQPIYVKQSIA